VPGGSLVVVTTTREEWVVIPKWKFQWGSLFGTVPRQEAGSTLFVSLDSYNTQHKTAAMSLPVDCQCLPFACLLLATVINPPQSIPPLYITLHPYLVSHLRG